MRKTLYHKSNRSTTNWSTLVKAKDESGELNKVGVRGAKSQHFFRIFVDEEEIREHVTGEEDNPVSATIPIEMEYKDYMKVEFKSAEVDDGVTFFVNFSYDVPEEPESLIKHYKNAIEARTGIGIGVIISILGLILTILGLLL